MSEPTVESLFAPFGNDDLPKYTVVTAEQMPEPYRKLLAHKHHMTVTVEERDGGPVDVKVLSEEMADDDYRRRIVLLSKKTRKPVLFGVIYVDLARTSDAVREAIIEGKTPLGTILIKHNVLREIEPVAYLKIEPGDRQLGWFELEESGPMYGRLAVIHVDGEPAVQLFEVVAP